MQYIIVAAVTFGLMWLLDKGFAKLFRNKVQHKSGLAVHLNKRYALFGLFMAVLGLIGFVVGLTSGGNLPFFSALVALLGVGLGVYYLSFGIFYDEDTFLYQSFGKKPVTYRYDRIQGQMLYVVQGGSVLVELDLGDGKSITVHSEMEGAYAFLDHAFFAWCRQKGIDPEACEFHDPSQSIWFPPTEV